LSPAEVKALWRALAPPTKMREEIKEVRRFEGHEGCVHRVAISPDGKLAASGGDDPIRLWDLATAKEIRQFRGHQSSLSGVAFSPDGTVLASSGHQDQTVRIWEVATGKELHCLRGNAFPHGIAFLPDGRHVALSGNDGMLRLWDVKSGDQVR